MQLIVLGDEVLNNELTCLGVDETTRIEWIVDINDFKKFPNADAWVDLLFYPDKERIALLNELKSKPVIINYVEKSLAGTAPDFIRINGWPTFLKRNVVEASVNGETLKSLTENIFSSLHRKIQWTRDEPGFISSRVVAMIINEAFFALAENVSTIRDIDTAMKLGTNYPYGPFEWGQLIGLNKVYALLHELSKQNKYYEPSGLLKESAVI